MPEGMRPPLPEIGRKGDPSQQDEYPNQSIIDDGAKQKKRHFVILPVLPDVNQKTPLVNAYVV
jgi:hypothetical protein